MTTQPQNGRAVGLVLVLLLVSGLLMLAGSAGAAPAAPTTLGWVGNLWPASGSTSSIVSGQSFDVYVQVWKDGVTNAEGQGADISCTLHWAKVAAFGGAWGPSTDTPMTYNTDVGNNDEYKATITPGPGLYEFTAFCTDLTDTTDTWSDNPSGNGKLQVTPAAGSCSTAAVGDDNIFWDGLAHDSFSTTYRAPLGAVTNGQGTVTLRFRTCASDVSAASIRVWDDRLNTETITALTPDGAGVDPAVGDVSFWKIDLAIPADPTILYYVFSATDGTATAYYRDDDVKFYGGGFGQAEGDQNTAYMSSYQLTVYDANFTVPEWMQRGVVYQVFPDRFRDGNSGNNPAAGRFFYNTPGGSIVRSNQLDWNSTICDPRSIYSPACANKYSENFYGGDLAGITQKINDGYFANLGVTVLYLNPIFRSPSNHKYDTANYSKIDSDFGSLSNWQSLVGAANANGIRLILDGVFNHTSSDSPYFDLFKRYNFADNLVSPFGPGTDDNIGACESPNSVRRPWYFIPDVGTPGSGTTDRCDPDDSDDTGGAWTQTYEAWFGYGSLPKLNSANAGVRDLFYDDPIPQKSIGVYWVTEGADGWRLDVGGDVDPGLTNDPANNFWEGFRTAIRDTNVQTRTVPVMVGEEWGDASAWLLGNEWDSAMNYRLRSAALSWLFTGCTGDGCTGGTSFEDNDSNSASASGPISALTPSQFNARLRSIQEDYPAMAFKAMMNLGSSHDTNRLRFLLNKINNDDDAQALTRMKEWWLFAYTYAGAPTVYYGDEVGLNQDGAWTGSKWEDDPYNRAPFPWPDTPGAYTADTDTLQAFARKMASVRHGYRALQDGDVFHGLIVDDANKVYAYARWYNYMTALVALNRDTVTHTVTFTGMEVDPYYFYDGELFMDALSGNVYTVTVAADTGVATLPDVLVPPESGVVLVDPYLADIPKTPIVRIGKDLSDVQLSWAPIIGDTNYGYDLPDRYEVWHSEAPYLYAGDGVATKVSDVGLPPFGADGNRLSYVDAGMIGDPAVNHYYVLVAANAAGGRSSDSNRVGEFDFELVPGTE